MQLMVSDGIDRLGFLIHDVQRLMRKRFEARASGLGLSSAQWRLMVRVAKEEGITQARLAELLEIEPISVSRLVDRMEESGWIERRSDAADRRVRMIFPTAKASQAYAEIKSLAGEVYEESLTGVSPQDRRVLIKALEAMAKNLADGETARPAEKNRECRRRSSMNAVAKVDENATKLEMEAPAQPAATPVTVAPQLEPAPVAPKKKRRAGRILLMSALPVALIAGGSYVWVTGGRYQETENANLQQAKVTIAADTAGRIVQVDIFDNQSVKQGDVLFAIDAEPYRIALAQADAAVAGARLNVEQLRAAYSQAVAQEKSDASQVDYAQSQYDRAADLARKGINAKSSLDEARNDLDKAKAATGCGPAGHPQRQGRTWRQSRYRDRQASDRDGGTRHARQGCLRFGADHGEGAGRRYRQPGCLVQGRPVCRPWHAAVFAGRDRRHLDRRQFQGNPAHQYEARPDG